MNLRPNYRRAREIKGELDQLAIDRQDAEREGHLDQADSIRDDMDGLRRDLALTGVTSEYEL